MRTLLRFAASVAPCFQSTADARPPTTYHTTGITADPDTVLHLKTLSFYLVKEGLAMLVLWLHGSIAYTLYAYTVQKVRDSITTSATFMYRTAP